MFFLPIFLTQNGLSGLQIGILLFIYTITGILSTLPIGYLNDRIHSRKLIIFGICFYILYLLALSFFNNFLIFIPFFIFGGMGSNWVFISLDSMFFRLTNNIDPISKIKNLNSFIFLFAGLGAITGSQIIGLLNFQITFRLMAVFMIFLVLIALKAPNTPTFRFELSHYGKEVWKKKVILFLLIFFIIAMHFGAESTSYALFLKNNLGLSIQGIGVYIGLAVILMFFWVRLGTSMLKKGLNIISLLQIGLLLSGTFHILMTDSNLYFSFFSRVIHEAGDAFLSICLYLGISRIFSLERIGGLSSLITFTNTLAMSLGALIYGHVGEKYGYEWPLILSGIGTLLALILVRVWKKENKIF